MELTFKFYNCQLLRSGKIVKDDLWVRNGKIVNPEPIFYEDQKKADFYIDCLNAVIVPGFIDVQINGGYGYDFSSDHLKIKEAVATVRQKILSSGVTSFCPTIVTSPASEYLKILPQITKSPGGADGAEVLGVHLEGPFINPLKKGAHPVAFIKEFEEGVNSLADTYGNLDDVSLITIAPELKGATEVIQHLSERNIVVSLGHSNGNLDDGEKAVCNGASFITHLFNAMLPFHHRDPGLVGLLTSENINRDVYFGIISDDIHTHPAAIRIAQRTHPKGLVLVTDAMAAMGLKEGLHEIGIGQLKVEIKGRKASIVGTDTLAGSISPMDECIRRFIKSAGVDFVHGIEAASLHPAKLLGIDRKKGTLNFGADADFVFLDSTQPEAIRVIHTFIAGRCTYSNPSDQLLEFKNSQIQDYAVEGEKMTITMFPDRPPSLVGGM